MRSKQNERKTMVNERTLINNRLQQAIIREKELRNLSKKIVTKRQALLLTELIRRASIDTDLILTSINTTGIITVQRETI